MQPARSLAAGLAALAFLGAAHAQEKPSLTPDQMTAEVMISALAPASYGDWAYRWDAVSIRVSSMMHWHLPEPDPRDRPLGATLRRNGWFSTPGKQIGVTAWGNDETVTSLEFKLANTYGGTPSTDGLLDALRAKGVTVTLVRESEPITAASLLDEPRRENAPRSATYRLQYPERDGAELVRNTGCTSPRSAAAQRCWATYTLELGRK